MLDQLLTLFIGVAEMFLLFTLALAVVLAARTLWEWIDERRRVVVTIRHIYPDAPDFDFPRG